MVVVVVVEVVATGGVVVVVTTDALFTAIDVVGATEELGEEGTVGTVTAGRVEAGAAAATAVTVTDCDAAPAAMVSFPAWAAEMRHVPVALNVTTSALMEQTDDDEFAMLTTGARKASLSTLTV